MSILVAGAIGNWLGGLFGAFVAALIAIPAAAALQIAARELSAPPPRAAQTLQIPPGDPPDLTFRE